MITTISTRVYNQDQSWYFQRTAEIKARGNKKHTLRVNIRRNAYDNQSYAKVERWNGTEWKNVVNAPITECECKGIAYVDNGISARHFEKDSDRLVQEAESIVA